MSSAVDTDANHGRTSGRDTVDDDQDGALEIPKCVVCLGEGRDVRPPRARNLNE